MREVLDGTGLVSEIRRYRGVRSNESDTLADILARVKEHTS